ncbi:MAG: 4-alpha-glucanotransferase, partial [Deltaproteobacteria bacterium]|nr:4-alpha-glucanotransferase [Deltaproteobacteria bacterium]
MKKKTTEFAKSVTAELARRLDIELDYINAAGKRIIIAPEVIRAVLATMGYKVENDRDAQECLERFDTDASSRRLPPVLVVRHDLQPARIPVNLETHQNHSWRLLREDGGIAEEGTIKQSEASNPRYGCEASLKNSQVALTVKVPCGYHRFELDDRCMPLIVVPEKCWLGPIERGQKLWGIAAQLYLLRSERNWGIGDFTDLGALIDIAAGWGASLVGLNPLHTLFVDDPEHASPYAPASRLYLNILNIDVTAIPEFATCDDAKSLLGSEEFTSELNIVRAENMVNYRRAAELKLRMLRLLHSHFMREGSPERRQALEAFIRHEGESLNQFCIFQAIRLELARRNCITDDWQQWPRELREPDSPGIYAFAESHRKDIDFFIWTQWIADTQLNDAVRRAEAHRMAVGLYRDLAVGSSGAGAETWSNPEVVVAGAHAGAPPDLLNPAGQDWGLPPFNPRTLRESGYAPFIELVRANMRYCGALRIDHVVGLQHLYWVPVGHGPDQGAYVRYPFDELAGIIALESQRNHCLVIGEDLGTVPAGFSEKLND